MQSLINYDKQRITIICRVIIRFRGWPELLNYTTSEENIWFNIWLTIKTNIILLFIHSLQYRRILHVLTIIIKQVNWHLLYLKNWKLHGVKKKAGKYIYRKKGTYFSHLTFHLELYNKQSSKLMKSSQKWMSDYYI